MAISVSSFRSVKFCFKYFEDFIIGCPGGSDGKESAYSAGDPGLIPGSGVFPGEGNGYPLQSSILAWRLLWTEEPGGLQSMGSQRVGYD